MPPKPPSSRDTSSRALRRLSRDKPEAAPVAAPVPSADRYWRAVSEAYIYTGPLGAKCGEVAAGTVAQELMRYLDPFDGMWIAINATDESVVWLSRYAQGPMDAPREVVWEPVMVEGEADAAAAEGEHDIAPYDVAASPLDHPFHLLTSDLTYYDWYTARQMTNQKPASDFVNDRDWNAEFQATIEEILFNPAQQPGPTIREKLMGIVRDFADVVEEATVAIVREMFGGGGGNGGERTVQRCPNAVDVFFHRNVMLKLCVDTAGGVYGGDAPAMKAATQQYRAAVILGDEAPKHFLHTPLSIVMTYRGYRVRATTIPPVLESRLVFGSASHGSPRVSTPPAVQGFIESCGRALNLKVHQLPGGQVSPFPVEAQVVNGLDERLYILNCARMLPPVAPPLRNEGHNTSSTAAFIRRLRPELVSELDRAISCDAFVPGCSTEDDNKELLIMTQWMRDAGIPTLGAILGLMEGFNSIGNHHHPQNSGGGKKTRNAALRPEDMLTFVVCRNDEECCLVSAEKCYELTTAFLKAETEEQYAAAAAELVGCVKCDAGARNINGLLMKPDVTTLFHLNGIPLRFLAYVHSAIPPSARPCTAYFLEIEMIARAAKNILLRKMRVAKDNEDLHTLCVNFYLALLQPGGELAEGFWENDLGPEIQRTFHVFVPFDTSELDTELVYHRVAELTGVELSPASVASLATEEPFVQLSVVHPIMKMTHLPELVTNVGGHEPHLKANLEALLLHWTNVGAPDDRWSEKSPVYLKQR